MTLEGFGAKNGKNVKAMGDASSAVLTIMCSIGDRLGLFKDLAAQGPATSSELAVRTGIDERYAREWLGAMASAGYVMYEGFCKPGRLQ